MGCGVALMDFLWQGFLVLLVVPPLLAVAYALSLRRRRPSGVRYSSLSLVRDAAPRGSFLRRHLPVALFLLGLASLVVALARPAAILSFPANETTIILTIDVSGSMCSTDIPPSRLEAAEAAAADFIKQQSATTQIGIVAFSGFAAVVQPPTTDQQQLLDTLSSLTTGRRTAIGSGILAAIDAISEIDPSVAPSVIDGRPGVEPPPVAKGAYAPDIIVLLTDGASNAGPDPLDAAQQAADRGIRIYTDRVRHGRGRRVERDVRPAVRRSRAGGRPAVPRWWRRWRRWQVSAAASTRTPSPASPMRRAARTTRPRVPRSSRASSRASRRRSSRSTRSSS